MALLPNGSIGWTILDEDDLSGGSIKYVGQVGSSIDPNNAPGVEIRGTTYFNQETLSFEPDFFSGDRSWWRSAFANEIDETPIQQTIGVSVAGSHLDSSLTGVIVYAYDYTGRVIVSEVDFVVGQSWIELMGESAAQFEELDNDFMSNGGIKTFSPLISGEAANVAYVGIAGFQLDINVGFVPLDYTVTWQFG